MSLTINSTPNVVQVVEQINGVSLNETVLTVRPEQIANQITVQPTKNVVNVETTQISGFDGLLLADDLSLVFDDNLNTVANG